MDRFTFRGAKTHEISFPLGGIGSGCIGLAGNGELIDAEMFNRPNKGSHLGFTHFAVKAENANGVVDARVLHGDVLPPYSGKMQRPMCAGFGFGPDRESLAGLPHFHDVVFHGTFPIANLEFTDQHFPGSVRLEAFNPFIPLNEDDSSIPGAFFCISITNNTKETLSYTICFSAANLYSHKAGTHSFVQKDGLSMVLMQNAETSDPDDVRYGDMSIGTDASDVHVTHYWYRGNWFDNLMTYWKDFRRQGPIQDRNYSEEDNANVSPYSFQDVASLSATLTATPGETTCARFVMTWSTPNCINYWNPGDGTTATGSGCDTRSDHPNHPWKNYYATLWRNSSDSLTYALKSYDRLYSQTLMFLETLLETSMPEEALEAVISNLAIIKSPTILRLTDGSLYGFEGCHWNAGSCEGSCTHVWSYTYSIPFLFPRLERSMRTLEYTYSMNPDGSMSFRLMLPIGRTPMKFRPCVDGQYGTVMRVWREYKLSGDREWLKTLWPQVKRSIEYAWSSENKDRWDENRDGVMEGRQHHTLDMEIFGESAWLTGMYLAGLKAGALIAAELGEEETAKDYIDIFNRGKERLNRDLFNGRYYYQRIDLKDRDVLSRFADGSRALQNQDVFATYWNDEKKEIAYQIADGCGIDQVLAQWHANLIGLGEIFDKDQVRSALKSIYSYNFIPNMREHFNPCRLYALNDEAGTVICAWPDDVKQPEITILYAEETMHGFEYQAATHMIQEGMTEKGLQMIRAIRERYDGEKRNPWNELESGSNYARSMASYSLLLSYSGFRFEMSKGMIGFEPLGNCDDFRSFWSVDRAWGVVRFEKNSTSIEIKSGEIDIQRLLLRKPNRNIKSVSIDGIPGKFISENGEIVFDKKMKVTKSITVEYA